ncbi:MAG: AAA family ATPase [Planctomycetota bacterium]|jgi:predicted ATPase
MQPTLQIENYKAIGSAEIELRPGLNILVGPNGSGKTCLLSSLKFVRDIFRVGAAQALARQGGALRVYRHNTSEMSFSITASYGHRTYQRRKIPCWLYWKIRLAQAGEERIATILNEEFQIYGYCEETVLLFSVQVTRRNGKKAQIKRFLCMPSEFGRDLFSLWNAQFSDHNKVAIAERFGSKAPGHEFEAIRSEPDRSCFPALIHYDESISDIYSLFLYLNEYNIAPDLARSSTEQLPFARMLSNGASVSEVIDALENERYHKLEQAHFMEMEDTYGDAEPYLPRRRYYYFRYEYRFHRGKQPFADALDNINKELAAAVRPITAVSVGIDPTNGKRFVVFKSDQDTFSPEEVSDGTIKWLCILVSLFVPFSHVYLLEEPENFLHPWMQQRLIALMREQAKSEKTVFFLSSHSATVLNGAFPEEILVVRHGDNGTEISQMDDIDTVKTVLSESDFHLGDLWVSGAIGGVPVDE